MANTYESMTIFPVRIYNSEYFGTQDTESFNAMTEVLFKIKNEDILNALSIRNLEKVIYLTNSRQEVEHKMTGHIRLIVPHSDTMTFTNLAIKCYLNIDRRLYQRDTHDILRTVDYTIEHGQDTPVIKFPLEHVEINNTSIGYIPQHEYKQTEHHTQGINGHIISFHKRIGLPSYRHELHTRIYNDPEALTPRLQILVQQQISYQSISNACIDHLNYFIDKDHFLLTDAIPPRIRALLNVRLNMLIDKAKASDNQTPVRQDRQHAVEHIKYKESVPEEVGHEISNKIFAYLFDNRNAIQHIPRDIATLINETKTIATTRSTSTSRTDGILTNLAANQLPDTHQLTTDPPDHQIITFEYFIRWILSLHRPDQALLIKDMKKHICEYPGTCLLNRIVELRRAQPRSIRDKFYEYAKEHIHDYCLPGDYPLNSIDFIAEIPSPLGVEAFRVFVTDKNTYNYNYGTDSDENEEE
jgi:hypothetical protein